MSINRKRGSIALARSLCYQINGAADDSDDMDGGGYGSVDIAEILSAEVVRLREALAQEEALQALHAENERLGLYKDAYAQPEQNIAALVEGMEVSIDVSTGDHDSGNRLFGVVDLVQENQGSKHGLILLVQEPEANFKAPAAQPQRTWVGLTDDEVESYWDWEDFQTGAGRSTILEMVRDIEAKLKDKNS